MSNKLLKVRVTLKGRPVRAYTFSKDVITVGRDPSSDIFLDNPGVSRTHCKIDFTSSGIYRIQDMGSANGIFVNEQPVKTHFIINNDVVFIGKFALWFMYEEDRRGDEDAAARRTAARTQDEGTTVLRTSELQDMITSMRDSEKTAPAEAAAATVADPATVPTAAAPRPLTGSVSTSGMVATSVAASAASKRHRSLVVLGFLVAFSLGYIAGGGLRWLPLRGGLAGLPGTTAPAAPTAP